MKVHDYKNAILCVVRSKTSIRQQHVFINSCAPIYLEQNTGAINDATYKFLKLVLPKTASTDTYPCPTYDTAVVRPSLIERLFQIFTFKDVSTCASYNDLLCVRMAIAKTKVTR